jgi:hypothetical protein
MRPGLIDNQQITVERVVVASLETAALRVCPETSGWIAEFSEHEAD